MKFGKEFSSQMVPEWQGAYMDYNYLKSILKDLHLFKLKHNLHHHHHHLHLHNHHDGGDDQHQHHHVLSRTRSLYRTFSGLIRHHSTSKTTSNDHHHDIEEHQVIIVHPIMHDGHEQDHDHHNHKHHHKYETKFLMSTEEGGEYELVFFRRLDDEFNKVNKFYIDKVEEVMKEAALLNKQMDALIAFRLRVDYPNDHGKLLFEQLSRDVAASAAALSASSAATIPSPGAGPRTTEMMHIVHMDVIEETAEDPSSRGNYSEKSDPSSRGHFSEEDPSNRGNYSEESDPSSRGHFSEEDPSNCGHFSEESDPSSHGKYSDESNEVGFDDKNEEKTKKKKASRPSPLEILNNVKINNTLETPRSTIKGILKIKNNEGLNFKKENLRKVEEQLKSAFIHFYHKLQLLKSYSFLNLMAFSKIMKRYDKVSSRSASRSYLNMVDDSYLGSSEDVTQLMERVEDTFVKHFSNSNRSKGMNILRPKKKRDKHRITFSTGFFAGCTVALIISLILLIHVRKILKKDGGTQYMETMFPLYSLFGFVVLHMLLYAGNIYYWRRYRINYPFIFGFKQGTELGYREVFLLSTSLATLALASVLANLDMEMDKRTNDYKAFTELIPFILVCLVLLIIFCPFNIVYRSSRFFLLRTAFHGIAAPLYKVSLPDFLLADQLTSQVQAIRSLEFYICYYGWGDYKRRQSTCKSNDVYNTFYYIIATIPYWSRFLQCLRRWVEEKDRMQAYNGLKYFCTIVAVVMRTAYSKNNATGWWILALISSIAAAVSSTYWDLVIDWGLLQRNSKNRWLRDKLVVSQKSVYFGAMVFNVLLRFAWLQTILNFQVHFLHNEAMIAIVACLEIIRRGVWNFFRLENEHLNNVGKYRAFKTVPLPFNYDEEDEKEE